MTTTANEAPDLRLTVMISTANIAAVADGEWALIAPYGDHPAPDGSYVQRFDRGQAEKVVQTWNSVGGLFGRLFKNATHGRLAKSSLPVWDGHPETDRQRWPKDKLLAEITDIRAGDAGLEGQVTWNAKGLERRTAGPLYPSPLWWHWPPSGEPPAVYPELLESVGLVTTPNISAVPAWTTNARMGADTLADNPAENQSMNKEQLAALAKALNQPGDTEPAKLIEMAGTAFQLSTGNAAKVTEAETALQKANAAKADIETKLTTANTSVVSLTGERDNLKTANTALTTERDALRTGLLDVAEKRGIISPAERQDFTARIGTANTAAAAITELQTRKPALNVTRIEIDGERVDVSTANARRDAFDAKVRTRMEKDKCDYDTAYARCWRDPALAQLTTAMQDPTKKAA